MTGTQTNKKKFWQFEARYWFEKLGSSAQGLSHEVADKVLIEAGLHPTSKSTWKKYLLLFVSQFKSPLMLLLIGAVIISAFLGDYCR